MRDDRLDAVIAEILEAAERGEAPDSAAYLRAHPDLADELREFLQDWRQFRRTAAAVPTSPAASGASQDGTLPRRIGNYELLDRIARGGMGVVYKARQLPLNRIVALKTLLRGDISTADELRRFQVEAEAAAQLDHPGIVPIYEVGQQDGVPFFSMRYLAGGSLADLVANGPLEAREAARLVREIAATLQYAHQQQVIHRDLKPSNVLLEWPSAPAASGPLPRLTDFGLAKRLAADDSFTQSGQILGTPSYMAPEQVAHQPATIGPATDIYALGAILYCLLTGRPPFQAADPLATLRQVRDDQPVPPSRLNPSTPRDLETIALRCLEKSPERRFASARELADEFERFLEGRPIRTRPIGRVGQVVRWARRQPLVAALLVAVMATMVLGGGTSAYFAMQQLQRRRELERSLYRSQIMQADLERQTGNVNRAIRLLDECQPRFRNWEWHFLQRRCHPERLIARGHGQLVSDVTYDPRGERFASSGEDGTIRIWDVPTGADLLTLREHHWSVNSVAFSPDGRTIASGGSDWHVRLWLTGPRSAP